MPEQTIQFTPAQQAAITARGGSLLVSAAAGSGKTRVLVERAVGLITDPVAPVEADSLLIVTFTNAAAAKLRADITARLGVAARQNPGDTRLRRQQLRLQRASIGTVDAFCLHFVRQNFSALGLPPDLDVADEAALFRIRQEVLADVLERAYEDPDFRAFADLYDRGRTDDTAGQTVLDLYDFLRTLPQPERSQEEFVAMWQSDAPPASTPWGRELLAAARARVEGALALLDAAARTALQSDIVDRAYSGVLADDHARLQDLLACLNADDWDAARAVLAGFGRWRAAGRIPGGKDGNATAVAVSELRDRAKNQVKALADLLLCTAAEYEQDRARTAPLIAALDRTVQAFSDAYFQAKLAEKILDYADYEHLTLQLLQTPDGVRTPLCRTVSGRISYVLVDEYQDTNALQDAIYFSLAQPDASNLFLVGDIKQSIYRFRQAEPAVFIEKQTAWEPYPPIPGQAATIALDANFRSAPAVVQGINYLFAPIFSAELGGVDYGPGQRLVVGKPDAAYAGLCEVDAIDTEGEADPTAAEARAIAARISAMVAEGFLVRDSKSETGWRPCHYGDFCVLLRSRGSFAVYQQALQSAGIPAYADVAADLLDAPHVRPFAALLRVIDNPAQDVELAAALLSPMFPFTPDDLVELRRAVPRGSLYGAVLHSGQERFAAFVEQLSRLRQLARTLPVDALIEELFARTGYLAAVGAMPDGPRCREELLAFAAWASGAGRAGLPALVRAMNAARQGGGVPLNGGGQARPGHVSIMTVHRSKGLEFPVVFVAGTNHKFNNSDTIRPVLSHRRLGVGVMLRSGNQARRYKTLPYAALAQAIRTETLSEEMRVLYVALTRAQDALIITVPLKKAGTDLRAPALFARADTREPALLRTVQSWSGWLLTAAMRHPASGALWQAADMLPGYAAADVPLTVRLVTPPAETEAPAAPPPAPPDAALQETLQKGFAWRPPRAVLRDVPAKVTVSALTHAARPEQPRRPAFMQKSGLTGAERGTAIHAFLQSVPFDAPAALDLQAEVRRQTSLRLLDPVLAEKLDLNAVRPFFEGPVWRRIRTAKRILREEPFITALPAGEVMPDLPPEEAALTARVLVQGIADLVLVFDGYAEILDYKTDRSDDPSYYIEEYAAQLRLYRHAFALRLGVPVTKLTIYSFTLGRELDVPLEP